MSPTKRKSTLRIIFLVVLMSSSVMAYSARKEIKIPDIPGYKVLKCDFHTHTVFSDGEVWPTIRIKEAWEEGLDAIALTDHVEYQPHKDDLSTDLNRPFIVAERLARDRDLILIQGAEITRSMPPGHLNAIFLKDVNALKKEEWRDAIKEAKDQGAFIFWNHPGWKRQQPDGISRWYPEHTELLENKSLYGIELVNESEYYPEAFQWCLDKNLTMMANTDIHSLIEMQFNLSDGNHRTVTLVFAKEKTSKSIKEALFAHRTAVYYGNTLIGKEEFLAPLFENSVSLNKSELKLQGKNRAYISIKNSSEVDYELVLDHDLEEINVPGQLTLPGERTVLFSISAKSDNLSGSKRIEIPYRVQNLKVKPEESLLIKIKTTITFNEK